MLKVSVIAILLAGSTSFAQLGMVAECVVQSGNDQPQTIAISKVGESKDLLQANQAVQWTARISDDGKSLEIAHLVNVIATAPLGTLDMPLSKGATIGIKQETFVSSVAPYKITCAAKPDVSNRIVNSKGERIGAELPVEFKVDSSVSQRVVQALRAAVAQINLSANREVVRLTNGESTNTISFILDWENESSNERSRTTVEWSGSKATKITIRLNGKNFDYESHPSLAAEALKNTLSKFLN